MAILLAAIEQGPSVTGPSQGTKRKAIQATTDVELRTTSDDTPNPPKIAKTEEQYDAESKIIEKRNDELEDTGKYLGGSTSIPHIILDRALLEIQKLRRTMDLPDNSIALNIMKTGFSRVVHGPDATRHACFVELPPQAAEIYQKRLESPQWSDGESTFTGLCEDYLDFCPPPDSILAYATETINDSEVCKFWIYGIDIIDLYVYGDLETLASFSPLRLVHCPT